MPEVLKKAADLRIPEVPRALGPRARIEALEDHLLLTAFHQGELEQARLEAHDALRIVEDAWDHLEGWEMARRTRTNAGVDDAKRQFRPDLYDARRNAQWLVKRLGEQIERLERDAFKCSRAYTMATGA